MVLLGLITEMVANSDQFSQYCLKGTGLMSQNMECVILYFHFTVMICGFRVLALKSLSEIVVSLTSVLAQYIFPHYVRSEIFDRLANHKTK